jgi:hypothetical protein
MSNAEPWAVTAGDKFREVARSTDIATTKLLAEGLTALTEALRELDDKLEILAVSGVYGAMSTVIAVPTRALPSPTRDVQQAIQLRRLVLWRQRYRPRSPL